MFVIGKEVFNANHTSAKTDELIKEFSDDKYIFYFYQFDDFTSQPSLHVTSDFRKIKLLRSRDILNDKFELDERGEYPSLAGIVLIYERVDFEFYPIWENVYVD